jgi:hypothetical protein
MIEDRCSCLRRVCGLCDQVRCEGIGDCYDRIDCGADCFFLCRRACSWWERMKRALGMAPGVCLEWD